jgi:hypothetical protein
LLAYDQNGKKVAFEVTELVDEKAVKLNKEGNEVYFDWTPAAVVDAVEEILKKKGFLLYKLERTRFSKCVLVIHTDEPTISYREYHGVLRNHPFQTVPGIDQAYILFSCDASLKKCPHFQLSFDNRGNVSSSTEASD